MRTRDEVHEELRQLITRVNFLNRAQLGNEFCDWLFADDAAMGPSTTPTPKMTFWPKPEVDSFERELWVRVYTYHADKCRALLRAQLAPGNDLFDPCNTATDLANDAVEAYRAAFWPKS